MMVTGRKFGIVLLAGVFAFPAGLLYFHFFARFHHFEGLQGPVSQAVLSQATPASWQDFRREGTQRLALLLTDETAPWLPIAHGLKALGVPFTITRDAAEAAEHRVILAYPIISGRLLSGRDLARLESHVTTGGTLIATGVLGGLKELFGFSEVMTNRSRFTLSLTDAAAEWGGFTEPEEKLWQFGNRRNADAQLGTYGYIGADNALAVFDDGAAAITQRQVGQGQAYALGFDLGAMLLAGQSARAQDLESAYVNAYTPQNDVALRFIERIWRESEPLAVSLGPVPEGRPLAVLLTHDIDFTRSLANAVAYAELEHAQGVRGTFFVQTKYMRDYNDEIILNDDSVAHLRRLGALGMELASHSVSHSNAFRTFALGTGTEQYPDYRPIAVNRDQAEGGSILGELRVSKYLVEALAPPSRVVSFRPGHLAYPVALPQALQASGYRYSSSSTSGNALSHLPIRLTYDRGPSGATDVFEFPVTIEDELDPPMGLRFDAALAVARKIARHGGIYVVLTHPNVLDHKLDFSRRLIGSLRGQAWFGTMQEFGDWWRARDAIDLSVEQQGSALTLEMNAPESIENVFVRIPSAWRLSHAPDGVRVDRNEGGVLVSRFQGAIELSFEVD